MEDKLPIYNIVMNEDTEGLEFVSFVSDPAIMEMGLAFNKVKPIHNFKFNKEKKVVVGPAMIADLPLYREIDGEGFYVVFKKEIIEKLVEKFNKENKEHKINVDHKDVVKQAFIKSNWIKEDEKYDKSLIYGFENIPVGSWFIEVKVDDDEFWQKEIKENGKFGFSVEGMFGIEYQEFVKKNNNNNMKLTKEEMAFIEKLRKSKSVSFEMASVKREDGVEIFYEGDVEVGTALFLDEDMTEAAPEGEHKLEDGTVIEIENGLIASIEAPEQEEEVEVEVEAEAEKEVEEEMKEEEKEVEAEKEEAEFQLTEEVVSEMINKKFEEVLSMIAEVKQEMENKELPKEEEAPAQFSKVERSEFIKQFRSKYLEN